MFLERPHVELSSFASWEEVGEWYSELARDRAEPGRAIERKARALVDGLTEDRARIAALYDYVRREIRYLGLEFGLARYRPHRAAEVLENGYGDCKDKHTLLAALLRAAGYDASPVLVSALREATPEVPTPEQFDHMITAVRHGGELVWLDSTGQVTPFGHLAINLRGKGALLIQPAGKSRLVELPEQLPFEVFEEARISGHYDPRGVLDAEVVYRARGDSELAMRMAVANTSGEARNDLAERMLGAISQSGEVEETSTGEPTSTTEPLDLRIRLQDDSALAPVAGPQSSQLPRGPIQLPTVPQRDSEDDGEPLELGHPSRYSLEGSFEFPAGTVLSPPTPITVERNFATYRSTYEVDGTTLRLHRELVVRWPRIEEPDEASYHAFRKAMESDLKQEARVTLPATASEELVAADAERLFRAGRDAYHDEDYVAAVQSLERAVELAPEHEDAWEELGRALVKAGRAEEAIATLRRQIEITPYHESVRTTLGWALEKLDRLDEAEQAYRDQLELLPLSAYATEHLGRLLWADARYEEAVPYLQRAVASDNDDHGVLWRLADALLHTEEAAQAEMRFGELIAACDDVGTIREVIWTLAEHRHVEPLVPLSARAVELSPDEAWSWSMRGWVLEQTEEEERAVTAYRKALEIDPATEDARMNLASSLLRLGRSVEAAEPLEAEVAEVPDNASAWRLLAGVRAQQGDQPAAIAAAKKAAAIGVETSEDAVAIAGLLMRLGEESMGASLLSEIERMDPGGPACGALAWTAFREKRYAEAATQVQTCLDHAADDPSLNHLAGTLHARQGEYRQALPYLERAAAAMGEDYPDREMLEYVRSQVTGDG